MKLSNVRNLVHDDNAVSPVIGVILMVAITVILAAVIGTFVLGLGDDVTDATAPTADFDFDTEFDDPDGEAVVTVTHAGGDSIPAEELSVQANGESEDWSDADTTVDDVTAGDSLVGDSDGSDDGETDVLYEIGGDTVQVVWEADGADSSQVLAEYDVPEE